MPLIPCKCPNCGGAVKVDSSKRAAICEYCDQPFVVEDAIQNVNVTNTINAEVVNIVEEKRKSPVTSYSNVQIGDRIESRRKYKSYTDYNHTYYDLRVDGDLIDFEKIRNNPKQDNITFDEIDLETGTGINWDNMPYNALDLFLDEQISCPLLYKDQIPDRVLAEANLTDEQINNYFEHLYKRHPELEDLVDEDGKSSIIRQVQLLTAIHLHDRETSGKEIETIEIDEKKIATNRRLIIVAIVLSIIFMFASVAINSRLFFLLFGIILVVSIGAYGRNNRIGRKK